MRRPLCRSRGPLFHQETVAIRSRYQGGSYAPMRNHEVRAGPRPSRPVPAGPSGCGADDHRVPGRQRHRPPGLRFPRQPGRWPSSCPCPRISSAPGLSARRPSHRRSSPAGHHSSRRANNAGASTVPVTACPRLRDPAGVGDRADWPGHRFARDTGPVGALTADQFPFHRRDAEPGRAAAHHQADNQIGQGSCGAGKLASLDDVDGYRCANARRMSRTSRRFSGLVDQDWRSLAACRLADPDLFFPISSSGQSMVQVAEAKAVCAGCRVRRECLAFALRTHQVHGVWGGLSEQERYPLRSATLVGIERSQAAVVDAAHDTDLRDDHEHAGAVPAAGHSRWSV